MSKLQSKGPIEDLTEAASEYIDLKIEEAKLKATRRGAKVLAHYLATVVILLFAFLFITFLMFTAAYLIGDMLSKPIYGFAIVTLVLMTIFIVLMLCRKKLFVNKAVRLLIEILFEKYE